MMLVPLHHLLAQAPAPGIFGNIAPPPGVANFNAQASSGIGIIIFASNIVKLIALGGGLFGFFNIISAGFTYLGSNGNPKATEEAGNKLFMSLIGLLVIVGSFTITAIISFILFGDASYILNPKITQAPTQ